MNWDKIITPVLVIIFGIIGDAFALVIAIDPASPKHLPEPMFWMGLIGFNGTVVYFLKEVWAAAKSAI